MTETRYSKRIFAFLDILGFKRIIDESREDQDLIARIARMLSWSEQIARSTLAAKLTVLEVSQKSYGYRSFSDTSVIWGPYDSHDDLSLISTWIMVYQYLMWRDHGAFVRGAVVYGDLYSEENVVFGPALIDAYHLESCRTKAVWPRVLVDESLLGKTTEEERRRDFHEFLRHDGDNLVYLDYLRELFHLITFAEIRRINDGRRHDLGAPARFFETHKQAIVAQAYDCVRRGDQGKMENAVEKYVMLSEYHNSIVDRLCRITRDLINDSDIIADLLDDQVRSERARKQGLQHQPKYSAEEHPEQSDMLNILGAVISELVEHPPPDMLRASDIAVIGQTDEVELRRAIRNLSREAPRALSELERTLRGTIIDTDSLCLRI